MYKKILVPLDGSKLAEVILPHVFHLAESFKSEILFLQVFQLTHGAYFRRQKDTEFQALPGLDQSELQQVINEAVAYLEAQRRNNQNKWGFRPFPDSLWSCSLSHHQYGR